jgi:hypothetical protein
MSPKRSVITVEFSMSLNMIVTVPSGAVAVVRSGRSSSIAAATASIDVVTSVASIPWKRSLRVNARSTRPAMPICCAAWRPGSISSVALRSPASPSRSAISSAHATCVSAMKGRAPIFSFISSAVR